MIWQTRTSLWLQRYGHWHLWFAWHPITVEYKEGFSVTRAWFRIVERKAFVMHGCCFWMYQEPTTCKEQVAPRPARTDRPNLKVVS